MSIGTYLRRLRKQKGYSIRQVVIKSDGMLDKTTVSRIERGERGVSVRALYAFSRIYDVPADNMLAYLIKEHVESDNIPFDANDEERRMIEDYRRLSRRSQNVLRELLGSLRGGGKENLAVGSRESAVGEG